LSAIGAYSVPTPAPDISTRERKRTASMTRSALVNIDAYRITVLSDGTTTAAEVTAKGPFGAPLAIGQGQARRRKGDPRKDSVGELLALARTFENAAKNARAELAAMGYEDVE
jgi:hypothetical protein